MGDKIIKSPQIRFTGFTDTWEQRKLGELGTVAMNKRIFKEETSEVGDVPFYKIGTFGGEPDAFISRALFEEYKIKYPYPEVGDILISASGSIGRTVVYQGKDEYFQDSNIVWLKHDERLDKLFLKQFYSIVKWEGLEGSTIKRLYNKNILDTNISLPSPAEQRKIGTLLAKLDNLITLHQRKLELLKVTKKSMLQKMFPKDGESIPEIRFAGFTDAWEQRKLGELGEVLTGTTPSTTDLENWTEDVNGHVWITPTDIDRLVMSDSARHLTDKGWCKARIVPENSVLITSIASIGKNAINTVPVAFNQQINAIIPQNNDAYFILSAMIRDTDRFASLAGQTATAIINKTTFEKFILKVPTLEEQIKIGKCFQNLDNLITLHQRELDLLKDLKKSMLQQMFI